jgi:uncharacterized protein (TIGR02147 family)
MFMNPSVFDYIDYRHYLTDLCESLRREDSSVSYRSFARMAGSSSPNFLQLIRDRKLNIGDEQLGQLMRALAMPRREQKYLQSMVAFDHAKNHKSKDALFRQMINTRQYSSIKQLHKEQYEFFSHWYIPVVRELITHPDYPDDPAWIADQIVPPVSPAKVKQSIALLEKLNMIKRCEPGGRWEQTEAVVSTRSEVLSLAVTNYHKEVIGFGRAALERFDSRERDIRGLTLGLTAEGYKEVKSRLEATWREILAYAETQQKAERIYQLNFQLFPLSKPRARRKRS